MGRYANQAVEEFYQQEIAGCKAIGTEVRNALGVILAILDREGAVSAIDATGYQDPEMPPDMADRLQAIGIAEHSLRVATTTLKEFRTEVDRSVVLVATLGHELGKVPAFKAQTGLADPIQVGALVLGKILPESLACRTRVLAEVRAQLTAPSQTGPGAGFLYTVKRLVRRREYLERLDIDLSPYQE